MVIKLAHFSPGRTIFLSLIGTILLSTALLALPQARHAPISFIDLLFTSTSALCVTGLFTVSLDQFTLFGHAILLILIHIGGLGLITITLAFMYLFAKVGFSAQLIAGRMLEIDSWKKIKKIVLFTFGVTIIAECCGALCILPLFAQHYPLDHAWFYAFFHAVSSFCNAGIVIGTYFSLEQYSSLFLCITMFLMIIGGIGFVTWYEIMEYIRSLSEKKHHHFSLHSKIVLSGTISLFFASAVIFWILERDASLASLGPVQSFFSTIFHAFSCKSTGFLLTDIHQLHIATLFMIMLLSFIGSSPASTGSGVKITTIAIVAATIRAAITGRPDAEICGRRIERDQGNKAIAISCLALCWIFLLTFFLLITQPTWTFFDCFFEAWTSFTNLGIPTGLTHTLSLAGKLCIITSMIIGRIGALTLVLALKLKSRHPAGEFSYPEERVMLG
ncbi:MAG TPA: potassium transporter TrkG [Candidatus Bathyarchaeia archaeon]|nr:potassium transporter TrkG [Candidatus Bathyarchaeia archaeon]